MTTPRSVARSEVAAKAHHLDIACSRCGRRGKYQVARLGARVGPDFRLVVGTTSASLAATLRPSPFVPHALCAFESGAIWSKSPPASVPAARAVAY